jgi:hypothetical protein
LARETLKRSSEALLQPRKVVTAETLIGFGESWRRQKMISLIECSIGYFVVDKIHVNVKKIAGS